jgi:hypothetical protein
MGNGRFLMADDMPRLLAAANIRREAMTDDGLQFVRRQYKNGNSYFIANKSDKAIDGWVPLSVKAASVVVFDPMLKTSGLAKLRTVKGETNVYLQLLPGESYILQTSPAAITGNAYTYYQKAGDAVKIEGTWALKFIQGGPTLPQPIQTGELKSWTDLGGDDVKAFSGTGSYSISFNKPKQNAVAWQLNLGKVYENAEVYLNGAKIATLIGPQYVVTIPSAKLSAVNRLEVKVANLMANRISDMERKNIPYKIFYNTNFPAHNKENRGADGLFTAVKWEPKPSGLVGPVTLVPLSVLKVK